MTRLVVRGVADAVRKGADTEARAEERLRIMTAAGFRGEIRVEQYAQDAPRRL